MPVPALELVTVIPPERVRQIQEYLEDYKDALEPDVSNYAKGRQRFWIRYEWDLKNKIFRRANHCDRLWEYCKKIFPEADLGLAAFGPVGINLHRDDSYADWVAYSINLGEIEAWLYEPSRTTFGPGPQTQAEVVKVAVPSGGVIRFNCKNRHGVLNPSPDRWSINLWHVKDEHREKMPQ